MTDISEEISCIFLEMLQSLLNAKEGKINYTSSSGSTGGQVGRWAGRAAAITD